MMKYIAGAFLLVIFMSGCIVTGSSGTRTEYEDKMDIIEKDYRDMKITKAEYIELKDRASQQGKVGQKSGSMNSSQSYP